MSSRKNKRTTLLLADTKSDLLQSVLGTSRLERPNTRPEGYYYKPNKNKPTTLFIADKKSDLLQQVLGASSLTRSNLGQKATMPPIRNKKPPKFDKKRAERLAKILDFDRESYRERAASPSSSSSSSAASSPSSPATTPKTPRPTSLGFEKKGAEFKIRPSTRKNLEGVYADLGLNTIPASNVPTIVPTNALDQLNRANSPLRGIDLGNNQKQISGPLALKIKPVVSSTDSIDTIGDYGSADSTMQELWGDYRTPGSNSASSAESLWWDRGSTATTPSFKPPTTTLEVAPPPVSYTPIKPSAPSTPVAPSMPGTPSAPTTPVAPSMPGTPSAPITPSTPGSFYSDVPTRPGTPSTPSEPTPSVMSASPAGLIGSAILGGLAGGITTIIGRQLASTPKSNTTKLERARKEIFDYYQRRK